MLNLVLLPSNMPPLSCLGETTLQDWLRLGLKLCRRYQLRLKDRMALKGAMISWPITMARTSPGSSGIRMYQIRARIAMAVIRQVCCPPHRWQARGFVIPKRTLGDVRPIAIPAERERPAILAVDLRGAYDVQECWECTWQGASERRLVRWKPQPLAPTDAEYREGRVPAFRAAVFGLGGGLLCRFGLKLTATLLHLHVVVGNLLYFEPGSFALLRGFEPVCLFQGRPDWRRLQVQVLGDTSREIHLTMIRLASHHSASRSLVGEVACTLEGSPIVGGQAVRTTGRHCRALRPERAMPVIRGWSRMVVGLATRHELQIRGQRDPAPQKEVQRILQEFGYYPRRWQEWGQLLGPEMVSTEKTRAHARSLTD